MLFTSPFVLAAVSLAAAFHIHPNGNPNECLAADAIAESARVHIRPCQSTREQEWFLNKGDTRVTLGSTNFCLDSGSVRGLTIPVIKTCDNSFTQNWVYTDDDKIQFFGILKIFQCITRIQNETPLRICSGDKNQIWTTTSNSYVPDMETFRVQGDKSSCS